MSRVCRLGQWLVEIIPSPGSYWKFGHRGINGKEINGRFPFAWCGSHDQPRCHTSLLSPSRHLATMPSYWKHWGSIWDASLCFTPSDSASPSSTHLRPRKLPCTMRSITMAQRRMARPARRPWPLAAYCRDCSTTEPSPCAPIRLAMTTIDRHIRMV